MELDMNIFTPPERLSLRLRQLYEKAGFRQYRMSRFEEYALYQENSRFLSGEQVITFTDLDGRLLALKPDVTLSIAKNARVEPGSCGQFYYLESVYRPSEASHTFREISQMGVECIGAVDAPAAARTVALALDTLRATERRHVLELGHMGYVTGLLHALEVPPEARGRLLALIRDKNLHELRRAAEELPLRPVGGLHPGNALCALDSLAGPWRETLERAGALAVRDSMRAALDALRQVCASLEEHGDAGSVRLDLSLVNDMEYYNGLLLRGMLAGVPRPVLRGGQYDPLAARFRPGARAIGFALYLNELDRLDSLPSPDAPPMISIALPKGRLGDQVYSLLDRAGFGTGDYDSGSRKLVFENPARGVRYFLVKPGDVAIYVEHGAADVGIVGKDILEESAPDVYELLDLGLGRCRMCVAAKDTFHDDPSKTLRVATKFPSIAKRHYASLGREIDVIQLHGSIELAPLLGLSDVIVDIVETGKTLEANHLRVVEEFLPISARFIANRSAYAFQREAIGTLAEKLREAVQ